MGYPVMDKSKNSIPNRAGPEQVLEEPLGCVHHTKRVSEKCSS